MLPVCIPGAVVPVAVVDSYLTAVTIASFSFALHHQNYATMPQRPFLEESRSFVPVLRPRSRSQ